MTILTAIMLSSHEFPDFRSHQLRMGDDLAVAKAFKGMNLQSGERSAQLLNRFFHVRFLCAVPYGDFCVRIGSVGVDLLIELQAFFRAVLQRLERDVFRRRGKLRKERLVIRPRVKLQQQGSFFLP